MGVKTTACICVVCGKPFTARISYAKYCSPTCKSRAYNERIGKVRDWKRGKTKWRHEPKTYAEIKEHNAKHPLQAGWRGTICGGGWSV